jgi:hypothetical protein
MPRFTRLRPIFQDLLQPDAYRSLVVCRRNVVMEVGTKESEKARCETAGHSASTLIATTEGAAIRRSMGYQVYWSYGMRFSLPHPVSKYCAQIQPNLACCISRVGKRADCAA